MTLPEPPLPRCDDCRWFRKFAWEGADSGGCHYNPPKTPGGFPIVSQNDWCRCWDAAAKTNAKGE